MGAEFYWEMASWWQGYWSVGLNQGYVSAGFGGKIGPAQLGIATWGENVGTKSAARESRRFLVEMALDF